MQSFLNLLRTAKPFLISVELRPPRAELAASEGIDAWIDTYHAVKTLARQQVRVMITDSAVGSQEENNLRHLVANLGAPVASANVVPFLTCKHSLEFCLGYADQVVHHGFKSLVVLGGDKHLGRPRCVTHASELRQQIRARHPELELGGWANPNAEPAAQVGYLLSADANADFYLTQIVSHHQIGSVEAFLAEAKRSQLALPGVFGVFFYRSANPRTLAGLNQFLPVPVEALQAEFAAGATAIDVCARTIRSLIDRGVRYFYISNLPLQRTMQTLNAILERAGVTSNA